MQGARQIDTLTDGFVVGASTPIIASSTVSSIYTFPPLDAAELLFIIDPLEGAETYE